MSWNGKWVACPRCRTQNPPGYPHCDVCGRELPHTQGSVVAAGRGPEGVAASPSTPRLADRGGLGGLVGGAASPFNFILYLFLYFWDTDTDTDSFRGLSGSFTS